MNDRVEKKILRLGLALVAAALTVNANLNESFESYTPGTSVIGVNGWSGGLPAVAVVSNATYTPFNGNYLLPTEPHTNVLAVAGDGAISNTLPDRVCGPTTRTTRVALALRAERLTDFPTADTDSLVGFGLNPNGIPYILAATGPSGPAGWISLTNSAVAPENQALASGTWLKSEVWLDFSDTSQTYVSVRIDEAVMQTSAIALRYRKSGAVFVQDDTGVWQRGARTPSATEAGVLMLSLEGNGLLDDVIVEATIDRTVLTNAIGTAQSKYDAAVEGPLSGQYMSGAKAVLLAAIGVASTLSPTASQVEVDDAVTILSAAIAVFDAKLITTITPTTVTLGNLMQTYDGTARAATATTDPPNLAVAITYNGSTAPPTNAGSYAVIATVTAANYEGQTNGTLTVGTKLLTITADAKMKVFDGLVYAPFTVNYVGFAAGESTNNLAGNLGFSGAAVAATGVGVYPIIPGGLTSGNYDIHFVPGALTIGVVDARATHTAAGYLAGSDLVVECTFQYLSGRQLQSLLWTPELPDGWTLKPGSASGDGNPMIDPDGRSVTFLGALSANPVVFRYTVTVPPGEWGTRTVEGTVEYQLNGMANPATLNLDPLVLSDAEATHAVAPGTLPGYLSGQLLTISNTFNHPAGLQLQSLLWTPTLPANWHIHSVVGIDGTPTIDPDGTAIILRGNFSARPLIFSYTVLVPPGSVETQLITAVAEYQLQGMANPVAIRAQPDPLVLPPLRTLHVISPYGDGTPPAGTYTNFYGSVLTNRMDATDTVGARTFACVGWLLTGNEPGTGTGIENQLVLTNNAVLTWVWVAPAVGNRTANEMENRSFQAGAEYSDANFQVLDLVYSLDAASVSNGMSITPTGAFSWTPAETQGGQTNSVTITVTDSGAEPNGVIASEAFTITVAEVNRSPTLDPLSDRMADAQSTVTFTATASDPDLPTQALTFTLDQTSLDAGMWIDPVSGVFTWSPTAAQAGVEGQSYTVVVTVTDDGANLDRLTDTRSFTISVADSRAMHTTFGYLAGRTVRIDCTFTYPVEKPLLSLLWTPQLPQDWCLVAVTSDSHGGPVVEPDGNAINFLGSDLPNHNPVVFSYLVTVPPGVTGTQYLHAVAEYQTAGMVNPVTIPVNPDPLLIPELHTFEVVAVQGSPIQPAGIYTNLHGTALTNTISTPLTIGTRTFTCTGWTLVGVEPATGTGHQVALTLTNDAVLTWNWVAPLIAPPTAVTVTMDEDGEPVAWSQPAISASEPYRPELEPVLIWSLLSGPSQGTANVSGTGPVPTIHYAPDTNFFGTDSFEVQVADGLGGFDQVTVNVTVLPVNDPPVLALIGAQQTDEFTPLTFTAVATDVDIPAQTLTFSISGAPPNATFDTESGVFTWVPTAGQAGTAGAVYTVTVTVTDDGTSPDNQSDSETFTVTLIPVRANHSTIGYIPGQLLAIDCEFIYPDSRNLQSLLWRPELPAGWTLESAAGEGSPSVDPDGEAIVLLGSSLSANPITFTYYVQVPLGATGTNAIGGLIEYQLDDMPNPGHVRAQPDPLIIPMLLMLPELEFNDRVYDGTTNATVATYGNLAGVLAGHDVMLVTTGAFAAFGTKLVGADKLVTLNGLLLTGTDAAWYAIGIQTNTATINPLLLTVTGTFTAEDKVYDGTTNAVIVDASALTLTTPVTGDDVTFVPVAFFDTPGVGDDKTVSLSASSTLIGTDAENYILSFENAPTALADILFPEVSATQACLIHFKSPSEGLCTISNTFDYPVGSAVATLTWKPNLLYPGWTVHTVQGDGSPVTDGTNIVFNNLGVAARPLVFTYTFKVPPGMPITNLLDATVIFVLEGVAGTLETPALPQLLLKRYHSADYQTWTSAFEDPIMIPDWKIDPDEAQRFNEYMRSGEAKYHGTVVTPDTPDGFDIGWTDDNSWYHSSDYQTWISGFDDPIMIPNLKFDVDEAQQLLNYVRDAEGAYHITDLTPDTPNGYGSGPE